MSEGVQAIKGDPEDLRSLHRGDGAIGNMNVQIDGELFIPSGEESGR